MLGKDDLDPKTKALPIQIIQKEPATILFHDLFTSEILYVDLGFRLSNLSPEQLPFMRLFSRALLEMGTKKETFVELIQHIGRETGGIHHSLFTSEKARQNGSVAYLFLRSKVMVYKMSALFTILSDILLLPNFNDKERFRQILLEEKSGMEAGLIPSGHRVVNNRLKSQYSTSAWMTEQMSGVDYLFFIRSLINNFDQEWERMATTLEEIKNLLFNQNNLLVNVTIDQPHWGTVQNEINHLVRQLPSSRVSGQSLSKYSQVINEGLMVPSQVNFVGKGGNIYSLGYKDHGSMNVILQYLRSTWLWEKVRVQGGAYGGFCSFDRLSGIFTFLSYRDPNLLSTIENYDLTAQFLSSFELSESELTKSIIGAIGELDAYQLPDAKGYSSMLRYILGITDEDRQKFRDELLSTSESDFRQLAEILEDLNKQASIIVLGSPDTITKVNTEKQLFSQTRKVL